MESVVVSARGIRDGNCKLVNSLVDVWRDVAHDVRVAAYQ